MKKFSLSVIIIALMAMNFGLYAQEKDTAQVEPKVKLELVWEKGFEDTVRNLLIGELTNGETYIKAVFTKIGVQFYDEKGSIVRKIGLLPERNSQDSLKVMLEGRKWKFKRAEIAPGEKFIGIHSGIYDPEAEGNIQAHYEIYDSYGNLQWEIDLKPAGVSPKVSPNGQFLIAVHFWIGNNLWVFDRRGLVKEIEIPGDRYLINSRSSFDEEANFVIASGDPKAVYVLVFDSLFNEAWRYNLGGVGLPVPQELNVSPKGKYISVVYVPDPERQKIPFNCTALLDKQGNLLWKKDGYYLSKFSPDGEALLLMKLRSGEVSLHETKTFARIYTKKIENEICFDAKFFKTKPFILVLMEPKEKARYVALWNMAGEEITRLNLGKHSTFRLASDNTIYIIEGKEVKKYKLIGLQ